MSLFRCAVRRGWRRLRPLTEKAPQKFQGFSVGSAGNKPERGDVRNATDDSRDDESDDIRGVKGEHVVDEPNERRHYRSSQSRTQQRSQQCGPSHP